MASPLTLGRVIRSPGVYATSALLLVWAFSSLWSLSIETAPYSLGLHDGRAYLLIYGADVRKCRERMSRAWVHSERRRDGGPWTQRPDLPYWLTSCTGTRYYVLPIWNALLLMAAPTLLVRARALYRVLFRAGACSRCGYDLRGLPAGAPCPECGGALTPTPSSPDRAAP